MQRLSIFISFDVLTLRLGFSPFTTVSELLIVLPISLSKMLTIISLCSQLWNICVYFINFPIDIFAIQFAVFSVPSRSTRNCCWSVGFRFSSSLLWASHRMPSAYHNYFWVHRSFSWTQRMCADSLCLYCHSRIAVMDGRIVNCYRMTPHFLVVVAMSPLSKHFGHTQALV